MTTTIRSSADGSKSYIQVGGTDRVTIDAATGAVGIGVIPSANSKLVVGGNTPAAGKVSIVGDIGGVSLALSDNTNSSLYVKHSSPVTIGTDPGRALAFASNGFTERLRISPTGDVLVTGGTGLGYGTGAGGTVTQATSKSTAVTLNKPSGKITMTADSMAAGAVIQFQLFNSCITGGDTIDINFVSGISAIGNYSISKYVNDAGQCYIALKNISAGALAEAIVLKFNVMKGANS